MIYQGYRLLTCVLTLVVIIGCLFFSSQVEANSGLSFLTVTDEQGEQEYSVKLQILLLMTALSFIPAFLLMATSFTCIIIVLSILRQALGLQQKPLNRILVGIALSLTILIMRPVWSDIYDNAFVPYDNGDITRLQAFDTAEKPIRDFMLKQTHQSALEQMMRIANEPLGSEMLKRASLRFVLPAFVVSELKPHFKLALCCSSLF